MLERADELAGVMLIGNFNHDLGIIQLLQFRGHRKPETWSAPAGEGRERLKNPPGPALPAGSPEWGIRWDPLAGEWVVIAAARQDRTFLPPADQCPLDPSAPGRPTEVPADSYDVVVFENRFPSLAEPLGRCEVVCFTSAHDSSFAQLTPRRVRTVLEA